MRETVVPGFSGPEQWIRAIFRAGLLLLGMAGASFLIGPRVVVFPRARAWADRLSPDQSMESFTPEVYSWIQTGSAVAGAVLLLMAGLAWVLRGTIEERLLASSARAAGREVDAIPQPPRTIQRRLREFGGRAGRNRPLLSAGAALLLVFWTLYLAAGARLWSTGLFDHYDGLFQSDPPRVIRDIAAPRGDGARSQTHPLFTLFFNPAGVGIAKVTESRSLAAVVLTSLAGAAAVVLSLLFFYRVGMTVGKAALWACLVGMSASHLVFSVVPETFIFAAAAAALSCLLAAGEFRLRKAFWAALLSFGITLTNAVPVLLLYAASVIGRGSRPVKSIALLIGLMLASSASLALLQKLLHPWARLFFLPSAYSSGVFDFVPAWEGGRAVASRAWLLARHMAGYNLLAPVPYLRQTESYFEVSQPPVRRFSCYGTCARTRIADSRPRPPESHPVEITFQGPGGAPLRPAGIAGMMLWGALAAAAAGCLLRRRETRSRLLAGMLAGLSFHFVLHMFFGDDFFLFSPHWTFLMIAVAGLCLRPYWADRRLTAAVVVLAGAQIWNNGAFLYSVLRIYEAGPVSAESAAGPEPAKKRHFNRPGGC